MRKIFLLFLTISLFSLSACSSDPSTTTEEQITTESISETSTTESSTTEEPTEETTDDVYSVAQQLVDQGLLTGERTEMYAELIHAISGIKYTDQGVEIYEYDTSSDTYSSLVAGNAIPIEGFDGYSITADAINGKFVLFLDDEKDQKIIDAFNALELSD